MQAAAAAATRWILLELACFENVCFLGCLDPELVSITTRSLAIILIAAVAHKGYTLDSTRGFQVNIALSLQRLIEVIVAEYPAVFQDDKALICEEKTFLSQDPCRESGPRTSWLLKWLWAIALLILKKQV